MWARTRNTRREQTNPLISLTLMIMPVTETATTFPPLINPNTLIITINHLNNTKSFCSDYISLKIITNSLYIIAFFLTLIINTSINTGIFPTAWKHAIVTPLHKKGDKNNTNTYLLKNPKKKKNKIFASNYYSVKLKENLR